jgi:hypothetical protein
MNKNLLLALLFIIPGFIFFTGCVQQGTYSSIRDNVTGMPTSRQTYTDIPQVNIPSEEKILTVSQIARTYHASHTYYEDNIFACGDMACDIWDMLKTEGINADIHIGRIDKDQYSSNESNHAWVLAEIEPGRWLAVETTGGYVVYGSDNPRYYAGWGFSTPKQFRDYELLITRYNDQLSKFQEEIDEYNTIVEHYNHAGLLAQLKIKDDLDTQYRIVEQRLQDLQETSEDMISLLENSSSKRKEPFPKIL